MRAITLTIALALLAAIAVVVVTNAFQRPVAEPSPSPSLTPTGTPTRTAVATTAPTPTATTTAPPTATAATTGAPGTITGKLGYPSEFIPPLTVYAISVADPRTFFSVETPRYPLPGASPAQPMYTITGVAPGTYYVLGYRNDGDANRDRPGVYSRYVICGGTPNCTDHSLAPVTVRAGETARDIDVTDWYYPPQQTYPPRPR